MDAMAQFVNEINKPADQIDIEICALLFASHLQADGSVLDAVGELDGQVNDFLRDHPEFAQEASPNTDFLIGIVDRILGYRGDSLEYYSPDNSLFDRVIDNRLGIPISLAAIYIAVGKRLGITVHGVGFPGHFLIRITEPDGSTTLADPFAHRKFTHKEVESLVAATGQRFGQFDQSWLKNAHPHDVLTRMLENLKSVYMHLNEPNQALQCLEFQLILKPDEEMFLQQLNALQNN